MSSLPVIAIIGRPNVGKSTLFNRLVGMRKAITSPISGTTRDRITCETEICGYHSILLDTGGMEFEKKKDIEADVQLQARIAVEEADLIYFVIDASEPLTQRDYDCALYLRRKGKPVIIIAHKADHKIVNERLPELIELGFGEAIPVSSIHNFGVMEMEEETKKRLRKLGFKKKPLQENSTTSIAIVGKPNVGKSSLINVLLGKNRLIVSEFPGTTIDATDTFMHRAEGDFILIDTAGIRRRGKVQGGVEKYGHLRALQAIFRCSIAGIMFDYERGLTHQDMHVIQYVLDAQKGLMILINKSDLMENVDKEQKNFLAHLHRRLAFIPWAPVLFISALSKKNIFKIFETAKNIADERKKKIPDRDFELFLKAAMTAHSPAHATKKIIITQARQTDINPPTFRFSTNAPDKIHFSYRRFLENEIRRRYGFFGTAIRLEFEE